MRLPSLLHLGDHLPQDENAFEKMILDALFLMGRQKSDISVCSLGWISEIDTYETRLDHRNKVRKTMADRDATHKPARPIEIDDPCYGTSKPEMRCRRVVESAKRVMPQIPSRSCPGFMFIANIKGNIRGVYHMAKQKNFYLYFTEF
jgi:hypothetical protein